MVPPRVRPTTVKHSRGYASKTLKLPRSVFSGSPDGQLKFSDSSIVRRSHMTVTAAAAPMTNAIRQPQACICSGVSHCCKMICTPSASSWPLVSVTY